MRSLTRPLLNPFAYTDWLLESHQFFDRKVKKTLVDENTLVYHLEVPGYDKQDLSVKIEDGLLKVSGKREDGSEIEFKEFVGRNVITTAKLKNGLLTVTAKFQKEIKEVPIE